MQRSLTSLGSCRTVVGALALATWMVTGGIGNGACPSDPDTDGDGVCDIDDNCVTVENPLQEDTYGPLGSPAGAFGDACEPIEAPTSLFKLKIRRGRPMGGRIMARGYFLIAPNEPFAPSTLSARVVDGNDLDVVTPGLSDPVLCQSTSPRNVKCKQAVRQLTKQMSATFVFSSIDPAVSRVVKFSILLKKLDLQGLSFIEPVTLTLSDEAGLDRVGRIFDCVPKDGSLRCSEP